MSRDPRVFWTIRAGVGSLPRNTGARGPGRTLPYFRARPRLAHTGGFMLFALANVVSVLGAVGLLISTLRIRRPR
jgi:hypothetical protein